MKINDNDDRDAVLNKAKERWIMKQEERVSGVVDSCAVVATGRCKNLKAVLEVEVGGVEKLDWRDVFLFPAVFSVLSFCLPNLPYSFVKVPTLQVV